MYTYEVAACLCSHSDLLQTLSYIPHSSYCRCNCCSTEEDCFQVLDQSNLTCHQRLTADIEWSKYIGLCLIKEIKCARLLHFDFTLITLLCSEI